MWSESSAVHIDSSQSASHRADKTGAYHQNFPIFFCVKEAELTARRLDDTAEPEASTQHC